jgi:predicted transcriptional regulator
MSIHDREKKRAEKVLYVGILSKEDYEKRVQAIARGQYVQIRNEPRVWFESRLSMDQVLSPENIELLRIIVRRKLQSLPDLEAATGRKATNIARTLKTLAKYGVVELVTTGDSVQTVVRGTKFEVTIGQDGAPPVEDTRKKFKKIHRKAQEAGMTRAVLAKLVKKVRKGAAKKI